MDTSNKFIQMCNCPEIQSQWVVKAGDWVSVAADCDFAPNEPVMLDWTNWNERFTWESEEEGKEFFKERGIWLLRQDQIQKMMLTDVRDSLNVQVNRIANQFAFERYRNDGLAVYFFNSWEQLWLAFLMREKYNKKWYYEEWV